MFVCVCVLNNEPVRISFLKRKSPKGGAVQGVCVRVYVRVCLCVCAFLFVLVCVLVDVLAEAIAQSGKQQ